MREGRGYEPTLGAGPGGGERGGAKGAARRQSTSATLICVRDLPRRKLAKDARNVPWADSAVPSGKTYMYRDLGIGINYHSLNRDNKIIVLNICAYIF